MFGFANDRPRANRPPRIDKETKEKEKLRQRNQGPKKQEEPGHVLIPEQDGLGASTGRCAAGTTSCAPRGT